eukprot:10217517-Ditylum_brightwellii.AAC.1
MDRALYDFGYLKKRPNQRISIDLLDLSMVKYGAKGLLDIDVASKLKDQYPEACESVDKMVPEPLLDELAITAYVDSDHAHDKVTQHSKTGLIIFVDRTPVMFIPKRQGAVETSTYRENFMAMKTAEEEYCSQLIHPIFFTEEEARCQITPHGKRCNGRKNCTSSNDKGRCTNQVTNEEDILLPCYGDDLLNPQVVGRPVGVFAVSVVIAAAVVQSELEHSGSTSGSS